MSHSSMYWSDISVHTQRPISSVRDEPYSGANPFYGRNGHHISNRDTTSPVPIRLMEQHLLPSAIELEDDEPVYLGSQATFMQRYPTPLEDDDIIYLESQAVPAQKHPPVSSVLEDDEPVGLGNHATVMQRHLPRHPVPGSLVLDADEPMYLEGRATPAHQHPPPSSTVLEYLESRAAPAQPQPPPLSSTALDDDEPVYLGSQRHISSTKGKESDRGQSSQNSHSGGGTPGTPPSPVGTQPVAQSDSEGLPRGTTLQRWRVPGYISEHSQPRKKRRPRSDSVSSQYSFVLVNESAGAPPAASQESAAREEARPARQEPIRPEQWSRGSSEEPTPAELVTLLVNDNRFSHHDMTEIFVPLLRAKDALWADSRDVIAQLQVSPVRVDGPARAYVMRGAWKHHFLRVEADGQMLTGLSNLRVDENKVLNINVEYIPAYAPQQDRPMHDTGPPTPQSVGGQVASRGIPPAPPVSYHQQSHARARSKPPTKRKRRHRSPAEHANDSRKRRNNGPVVSTSHAARDASESESDPLSPLPPVSRSLANEPTSGPDTGVPRHVRQTSAADTGPSGSSYPASTSRSSASVPQLGQTSAEPEYEQHPSSQVPSEPPAQSIIESPIPSESAFISPVASQTQPAPLPLLLPLPHSTTPPAAPSTQPTPGPSDTESPRPQARYSADDSDSDIDTGPPRASASAGQPRTSASATGFGPSTPAHANGSGATASAVGLGAFGKFATAGTTGFASFRAQAANFGGAAASASASASASTSTSDVKVAQSSRAESGTFSRTAGFAGAFPGSRDSGLPTKFNSILKQEAGYQAFIGARAAKLSISEQIVHWRYLKNKLDEYADQPEQTAEGAGRARAVTKEQVVKEFGVTMSRADDYMEALALTALYGPRGSRGEVERVAQMYHEPCPVASNIQLGRYLALLREAHIRWEAEHGTS